MAVLEDRGLGNDLPFLLEPQTVDLYSSVERHDWLGRTSVLLDPIWTLCPGPVGAAMDRSHAVNQHFGTLDTARDRMEIA